MRTVVMLVGSAACGTPAQPNVPSGKLDAIPLARATPSKTSTTTFVQRPLVAGDRFERSVALTWSMNMQTQLSAGQASSNSDSTNAETTSYTGEVVEAKGSAVTKLRLLFDKVDYAQVYNGSAVPHSNKLVGKSFVVEGGGPNDVDVKDVDGKKPESMDVYEAKRCLAGFDKADPFYESLPTMPLERGQRIEVSPTRLAQFFEASTLHSISVHNAHIIYTGEVDGEGVFEITMSLRQPSGLPFVGEVRGEARVSLGTSMTTSLVLEGPVKIEMPETYAQQGINYVGNGIFGFVFQRRVR